MKSNSFLNALGALLITCVYQINTTPLPMLRTGALHEEAVVHHEGYYSDHEVEAPRGEQQYPRYDVVESSRGRKSKGSLISQMGKLNPFGRKKKIPESSHRLRPSLYRSDAISSEASPYHEESSEGEEDEDSAPRTQPRLKKWMNSKPYDQEERHQYAEESLLDAANSAVETHITMMKEGRDLMNLIAEIKLKSFIDVFGLDTKHRSRRGRNAYSGTKQENYQNSLQFLYEQLHTVSQLELRLSSHIERLRDAGQTELVDEATQLQKDLKHAEIWITEHPQDPSNVESIQGHHQNLERQMGDLNQYGCLPFEDTYYREDYTDKYV